MDKNSPRDHGLQLLFQMTNEDAITAKTGGEVRSACIPVENFKSKDSGELRNVLRRRPDGSGDGNIQSS